MKKKLKNILGHVSWLGKKLIFPFLLYPILLVGAQSLQPKIAVDVVCKMFKIRYNKDSDSCIVISNRCVNKDGKVFIDSTLNPIIIPVPPSSDFEDYLKMKNSGGIEADKPICSLSADFETYQQFNISDEQWNNLLLGLRQWSADKESIGELKNSFATPAKSPDGSNARDRFEKIIGDVWAGESGKASLMVRSKRGDILSASECKWNYDSAEFIQKDISSFEKLYAYFENNGTFSGDLEKISFWGNLFDGKDSRFFCMQDRGEGVYFKNHFGIGGEAHADVSFVIPQEVPHVEKSFPDSLNSSEKAGESARKVFAQKYGADAARGIVTTFVQPLRLRSTLNAFAFKDTLIWQVYCYDSENRLICVAWINPLNDLPKNNVSPTMEVNAPVTIFVLPPIDNAQKIAGTIVKK